MHTISFDVFDRYGERVYHTTDYLKGWDGKIRNMMAVAGDYVAVAKAIDYLGKQMTKSVNVILIR